jgi:lysophospholipase L1-like esterase
MLPFMQWYEEEVRAKELNLKQERDGNPALQNPIVFFGSSSFRLWPDLRGDFAGMPLVNAAFGGSTLVACAWFFDRLVVPLQPQRLVVYAGDNDLGDGADVPEFSKRLQDFLTTLDHFFPRLPLTMLTIKPSPVRAHLLPVIQASNEVIRSMVQQRAQSAVVDIHDPMLTSAGSVRPELFSDDQLHMSAAGYELWRDILLAHAAHVFGPSVAADLRAS